MSPLSPWVTSSLWKPPLGIPFPMASLPPWGSPHHADCPSLGTHFPWGPPSPWGLLPSLGTPLLPGSLLPLKTPTSGTPFPLGTPSPAPVRGGVVSPRRPPTPAPSHQHVPPSLASSQSPWREARATCPSTNQGEARTVSSPSPSPSSPLTRLREKE